VLPGQTQAAKEKALFDDKKIIALQSCDDPNKVAFTTLACSDASKKQYLLWSQLIPSDFVGVKEFPLLEWEVVAIAPLKEVRGELANRGFGMGDDPKGLLSERSYRLTMDRKGPGCGDVPIIEGDAQKQQEEEPAGGGFDPIGDAGADTAGVDLDRIEEPEKEEGYGDSDKSYDDDNKDEEQKKDKSCPPGWIWDDEVGRCVRDDHEDPPPKPFHDDPPPDDDEIEEDPPPCPPGYTWTYVAGCVKDPQPPPPPPPPPPTIGTKTLHTPQFKFEENDIFRNVIKSHPKWSFMMYFNDIYLNRRPEQGTFVSKGKTSLYEMNVQTASVGKDPAHALAKNTRIRAYVAKGENPTDVIFKTVATSSKGFIISPAAEKFVLDYPLTSSISREMVIALDDDGQPNDESTVDGAYDGIETNTGVTSPKTPFRIISLKNIYDMQKIKSKYFDFDKYIFASGGIPPRPHYKSFVPLNRVNLDSVGKNTTFITPVPKNKYTTLIAIPSIFYGSGIRPGSVDLQFFWTGSLLARAQDTRKNGELIETFGGYKGKFNSSGTGSVIGTVLYDAGVILITASYQINSDDKIKDGYLCPTSSDVNVKSHGVGTAQAVWRDYPRWAYFGKYRTFATSSTPLWKTVDPKEGTPQGDPSEKSVSASYAPASSSYVLNLEGTEKTPVITMLAHAKKNELNWSNNPTYIKRSASFGGKNTYDEIFVHKTSSVTYVENKDILVKNTISSSFCGHTASHAPQTFISKIGIYNECKELIAVAKLATPIRKTNEQDYTFKLKLDL